MPYRTSMQTRLMPGPSNTADTLHDLRRHTPVSAPLVALGVQPQGKASQEALELRFTLPQGSCLWRVSAVDDALVLDVRGTCDETRRILRNALVVQGGLSQGSEEHHVLEEFAGKASARLIGKTIAGWTQRIQAYAKDDHSLHTTEHPRNLVEELGMWWDGRANFGDLIGPWLVETMTGKPIINARFAVTESAVLSTVGSIIHMITHDRTDVWGSGLMYPPTPRQIKRLGRLRDVRVHAVRGKKTRESLIQALGWDVPEVFGDPALLLPRYLQPEDGPHTAGTGAETAAISVVPHYKHAAKFMGKMTAHTRLVDVHDDLRNVVSSIATSRACLSTSLHGIIIAQAYGVPWRWLKMEGHELQGGDFKFEDFFSTLTSEDVSSIELSNDELKGANLEAIAEEATLPELDIDLDALDAAFPHPRAGHRPGVVNPAFSWRDILAEDAAAAVGRSAVRRLKRGRKAARRLPRTVTRKLPI